MPSIESIFSMPIIVEPDRQRLFRFVIEAVRDIGASSFAAIPSLLALMGENADPDRLAVTDLAVLETDYRTLYLKWGGRRLALCGLNPPPSQKQISAMGKRFADRIRSADPELLNIQNARIRQELDRSKALAEKEIAEFELLLEKRKEDLQRYIVKAETDALTGLFNRGAFDKRLLESFRHCSRQQEPLTLMLLDLDNFKQINDRYGHPYGDEVLRRMASTMRGVIRENVDLPCRIGGDEFAIILFMDLQSAPRIADRILAQMDGRVSIGIAELQSGDTPDSFIQQADTALYAAKTNGRGQYVMASGTLPADKQIRVSAPA